MREKLITLTLAIVATVVLAVPAGAGPGKGPKSKSLTAAQATCLQGVAQNAKAKHKEWAAAHRSFHHTQKAALHTALAALPAPTQAQVKALREAQRVLHKGNHEAAKNTAKTFRAAQKLARQGCLA